MAKRLRKLRITRVALVDRGANYDVASGEGAHVLLYKRADDAPHLAPPDDQPTAVTSTDSAIEKSEYGEGPSMPDEILAAREAREHWYKIHSAFMASFDSIMCEAPAAEQPALLQRAVQQFSSQVKEMGPALQKALTEPEQEAMDLLTVISTGIEKVSAKISQARMARLQAAMTTLKGVMDEAGREDETTMQDTNKKAEEQILELTKRAETAEADKATLQRDLQALTATVTDLTTQVEKAKHTPEKDTDEEEMWKGVSPRLKLQFEKMAEETKHAKELAEVEKARRERGELLEEVKKLSPLPINPDDDWETLKDLKSLPEKSYKRVMTLLRIGGEAVREAKVLESIGKEFVADTTSTDAGTRLHSLAMDAMQKGEATTYLEAVDLINKRYPGLYREYAQSQGHALHTQAR